MKSFFSGLKADWQSQVIVSLVFLFPVLVATMKDAGSVIYALLSALSLFHCRDVWKNLNRGEKRFLLGFAAFFFFSLASLLMTEDMREGLKRLERYVRLLAIIPIYFMLRKKQIVAGPYYLAGAFVAVFVMAAQAWYEVEVIKNAVAFGAYHKIIFGNQAILCTSYVVCGIFFFGKRGLPFFIATLAVVAGVYASLLSGSRTSWFFVPFILICLGWLYRKKIERKTWGILISGVVVVIILIIALRPERLVSGLKEGVDDLMLFQEDPNKHSSLGARLVMWRNSLLIFKDSPFIGTGMGDFKHDSRILFEKGLSYKNDFAANQANAHNLYFQLLAEGGLSGLVLLVTALFILPFLFFRRLWQRAKDRLLHCYTLSGLIGVLAFTWFGVSESWVNRNPMMTTYCVTMLVFLSSATAQSEVKTGRTPSS
ncbi:MAG: O-antigen ligase family protein [Nitrospiria bacterium]